MDHLRRLGTSISISLPADGNRFTGRECPQPDCEGYFKIELGTGLKGDRLPCHCPYCGHADGHDQFCTKEQIAYAKSVVMRKITDAIHKDLKKLEFDHKPEGAFGIGFSMKVKPGRLPHIHHYREKQLETEVVCTNCTLRYSVYGVFAFCPDCGEHNSIQILNKNLEVVRKDVGDGNEGGGQPLLKSSLRTPWKIAFLPFDGFGREVCRGTREQGMGPQTKAEKMNFQNLEGARKGFPGAVRN